MQHFYTQNNPKNDEVPGDGDEEHDAEKQSPGGLLFERQLVANCWGGIEAALDVLPGRRNVFLSPPLSLSEKSEYALNGIILQVSLSVDEYHISDQINEIRHIHFRNCSRVIHSRCPWELIDGEQSAVPQQSQIHFLGHFSVTFAYPLSLHLQICFVFVLCVRHFL